MGSYLEESNKKMLIFDGKNKEDEKRSISSNRTNNSSIKKKVSIS